MHWISQSRNSKTDDENDNCSKCNDLDRLVDLIQAKVAVSLRKGKIKLLTLAPESWAIQKVIKKFNISEYVVKKARALKKEHGTLSEPKAKPGRALSKDIIDCVINFYFDDQYSRMCAGKKECLNDSTFSSWTEGKIREASAST